MIKLTVFLIITLAMATVYTYGMGRPTTKLAPIKETSIYDFTIRTLYKKDLDLMNFKGDVLLIVNTATYCGFTNQYEGLETLHNRYKDKGFSVIGFPANNFMGQEPNSNDEIQAFCRTSFSVTFPMSEKISVKGSDIHPIYRFLTEKETNPKCPGKVSWNFNKFLIGPDGTVVSRYGSSTKPLSKELIQDIDALLK